MIFRVVLHLHSPAALQSPFQYAGTFQDTSRDDRRKYVIHAVVTYLFSRI
jgi:hypothetical protein